MYVPEELCKWPFPMEGMHQVALAQRASTDGCKGTIVTRNHGVVRQKNGELMEAMVHLWLICLHDLWKTLIVHILMELQVLERKVVPHS